MVPYISTWLQFLCIWFKIIEMALTSNKDNLFCWQEKNYKKKLTSAFWKLCILSFSQDATSFRSYCHSSPSLFYYSNYMFFLYILKLYVCVIIDDRVATIIKSPLFANILLFLFSFFIFINSLYIH